MQRAAHAFRRERPSLTTIGDELPLDALGRVELKLDSRTWRIGITWQPTD